MLRRMILGMLTAAVLLTGHAGRAEENAPLYAVQLPDGAALVSADGTEAAQPGAYGILYELDGFPEEAKRFAAGKEEGMALLDEKGSLLTDFSYQMLEYADGVILCSENGRQGVMDTDGRLLIEPLYTGLVRLEEGRYLALKTDPYDDSPDMLYLVDGSGGEKSAGIRIMNGLYNAAEGLIPAVSAENGLYGYLNAQGQWAVKPSFEWAGAFHGGRAEASGPSGAGLIDKSGNWLIRPEYDHLSCIGGDVAVGGRSGVISIIDAESGQTVAAYKGNDVYGYPTVGDAAVVMADGYTAVVDRTGAEILRLEGCHMLSQWSDMTDTAIAAMGDSDSVDVCLYRLDGTMLAGPYRDIMPLGTLNGEMYYTFTMFDTEMVEYSDYGLTFWDEVPGTRRCGVLSPEGEELCRIETEYISCLSEGRMVYQQEGVTFMADFSGKILWQHETEGMGEGQ